jgi:hypothetical protein
MKYILGLIFCTYSTLLLAANEGLITSLGFAGGIDVSHPDVVQVSIEGGYDFGTCHNSIAGIRKEDVHLIGAVMAAYAQGKPIKVWIDEGNDIYFQHGNRCVISSVSY